MLDRSRVACFEPLEPRLLLAGDGLLAQYFHDRNFVDSAFERVDAVIDYVFDEGSPDASIANDNFSIRWSGQIEAQFTETYTIRSRTDDGVRVWVDDVLVIDEWYDRPPTDHTATVDLVAGERVNFRVEYYENGGGAQAQLFWSSASQPEQIIPQVALYSGPDTPEPPTPGTGDGLLGQYYGDRFFNTQVLERVDSTINFDYESGSPDPLIANDNFGVRWSGQLEALYSETYTLRTMTDDGVRLYIDGQLVIDDFTDHPAQSATAQVALVAGQRVDIVMEYYENGGGASAQLFWSSPSQIEQIIPQSALYSSDVAPPNRAPIAADDAYNVTENSPGNGMNVLANDTDADGDPLRIVAVATPAHGSIIFTDTLVSYTPTAGYVGADAFTYTISDGNGGASTAQVTINVTEEPPVGSGDGLLGTYFSDRFFGTQVFERIDPTIDFLFDDGSPDPRIANDNFGIRWSGQLEALYSETYTLRTLTDDGVRLYIDGELVIDDYIEHPATSATAQVAMTAGQRVDIAIEYFENGGGASAQLFWSSDSQPEQIIPRDVLYSSNEPQPNTDPVANPDVLTLFQDTGAASVAVLDNDTDADGDALTVTAVTQATHGSVSIDGAQISYTPQSGFSGSDSFTYTISDGRGGVSQAEVTVNVTAANHGVIQLSATQYTVNENAGTVTITVLRTGGTDGAVEADYTTVDGTATQAGPDADYVASSGTLFFADGQDSAQIVVTVLDDALGEGPEEFAISLDRVSGGVALGAPRTALINIADNDLAPMVGNGLLGEYYDNIDFSSLVLRRTDPMIGFDWEQGSPDPILGADTYSVHWTGQILAEFTEIYTFRTHSDDGIRLKINGETVIDEYFDHGPTSHTGTLAMVAGQKVDIDIVYYENTGQAVAQLYWSSPSQSEQLVPTSALFSDEPEPVEEPVTPVPLVGETVIEGLTEPSAIDFASDGTMFILEKSGVVRVFQNDQLLTTPFVDYSTPVNDVRDRGALGFAVHPDFPSVPYVYMLYTYDPPETQGQSGLAAPDNYGNRASRLTRFTADPATGYTTAVPGSDVTILGTNSTWENIVAPHDDSTGNFELPPSGYDENGEPIRDFIASDSQSHTIGSLDFGLDGSLYVSIGDGTSYGLVDPRTLRVQDIDSLSGKTLRIDPITGEGLSNNPFYNGDADANRSKVFSYGFRNPFRIAVDPASGDLFVGDVGWTRWEEINRSTGGENFGWPYFEGGDGVNRRTTGYRDLPEAQVFYDSLPDVEPPYWSKRHVDGAVAIVLGDFVTGNRYPGYENTLFFSDYGEPEIRAIMFRPDGTISNVVVASPPVGVVVEMTMGVTDGYMYYVDLVGGKIGRFIEDPASA